MKLLNGDHVKQLFEQEAVLIGCSDGVPAYRAVELFGLEAVQYNVLEIEKSGRA